MEEWKIGRLEDWETGRLGTLAPEWSICTGGQELIYQALLDVAYPPMNRAEIKTVDCEDGRPAARGPGLLAAACAKRWIAEAGGEVIAMFS
jgi:hypothetical protein